MAVTVGTMAGRFSATAVGKRERAGEGVLGDLEAVPQSPRTAAEAGSLQTAGIGDLHMLGHLIVIIQSDMQRNKHPIKCFSSGAGLRDAGYFERAMSRKPPLSGVTASSPKRLSTLSMLAIGADSSPVSPSVPNCQAPQRLPRP